MPTLTHWIALCSLACSCHAATSASLVARYGLPVTQQFDAALGIRVTVEYGPDLTPRAVQIAPQHYNPNVSLNPLVKLDALTEVAAFFVPTARRSGMSAVMFCLAYCDSVETDSEFTITTRFTLRKVDGWASAVTVTSNRGLTLTSGAMQARFGSPVVEQFVADGDIELTAKYDAAGKAEEIEVASFLATRNLTALAVDNVLNELVPLSERTGKVGLMAQATGLVSISSQIFDNVTISRTTVGDMVQNATVRWGPRPAPR